ncbi:TraB/GumN family protein [Fontibacillus sp. BL9]|uniref:TraB/GumN family protein n=1 Tax=Fontibacillus sp. BL9 TaxID=3389971 RepID=UPI00397A1508
MKMKKITASFLSLLLAVTLLAPTTFAAANPVSLQVDGEKIGFDGHAPVIDRGTTLVPVEELFEALDLKFEQDAKAKLVKGTKGDLTIELQNGNKAVVNGEPLPLISEPKVIKGITYLPVRSIGEAAGYEIYWDEASRTVILKSKEVAASGGRGFLWEVENAGNKVYLLGSMHIADSSFYPLQPAIENAFTEADYLGVEVDIAKAADPETQQLVLKLGSYQDGTTLKDHISETTYAKLGKILAENGLDKNALDAFKPWVVESTLSSLQAAKTGYEGQTGIDLYFLTKAMERKLPIIELESYESQLGMFNNFSQKLQEDNLLAVLNNFDQVDDSVAAMAEMWKTGDDEALLELVKEMGKNEEYNKAMLVDRNIGMADKIEGYLKGKDSSVYLIVVGAAHMAGDIGIVNLLEEKGFTVTRK